MPSIVGATTAGGWQAATPLTVPTGVQEGDTLVAWLSANSAPGITPPAGWDYQPDGSVVEGDLGTLTAVHMYTRTATTEDTEEPEYTWTWSGEHWHHGIMVAATSTGGVRAIAAIGAEDVSALAAPSLAAESGDLLLAYAYHWATEVGTEPAIEGLEEVASQATMLVAAQEGFLDTGPTGAYTATSTVPGRMAVAVLLLEPAPVPTPAPRTPAPARDRRPPSGWRYHAMNLRTRAWIHRDLPLRDVSLKPVISGPYELSATIAPDWPDLIGDDGEPVLKEWSTLILAEHQDVIRGGGIVTAAPNTGPALELSCTGFTGYPSGQPLVSDLTWGGSPAGQSGTGVDPADVYRALWAHLQSLPGGNLGVVVDPLATPYRLGSWYNARKLATSDDPNPKASDIEPEIPINQVPPPGYRKPPAATGKTVHWQYGLYTYDNVDVGAKLDELAKMAPLDWREEYVWADAAKTDVVLRLRLGYPRLGRRRDDLRFVEGENVTEVIPLDRDAGDYANVIVGRGAGEGSKQLTTTVSGLEPDRLRRARALDRGDTTTEAALRTEAMEELGRSLLLGDVSSVIVDGTHPHAPLGSFQEGDDIYVQLHVGWRQLGLWVRVLAMDYTPYAEQPRITLTCARSDSFDYAGGS